MTTGSHLHEQRASQLRLDQQVGPNQDVVVPSNDRPRFGKQRPVVLLSPRAGRIFDFSQACSKLGKRGARGNAAAANGRSRRSGSGPSSFRPTGLHFRFRKEPGQGFPSSLLPPLAARPREIHAQVRCRLAQDDGSRKNVGSNSWTASCSCLNSVWPPITLVPQSPNSCQGSAFQRDENRVCWFVLFAVGFAVTRPRVPRLRLTSIPPLPRSRWPKWRRSSRTERLICTGIGRNGRWRTHTQTAADRSL